MYLLHNTCVMIIVTCYVMVCNELCVRCGIVFKMCYLEYVINREGVECDL